MSWTYADALEMTMVCIKWVDVLGMTPVPVRGTRGQLGGSKLQKLQLLHTTQQNPQVSKSEYLNVDY